MQRYHDHTLDERVDEAFQALEAEVAELSETVVLRFEGKLAALRDGRKAIVDQLAAVEKMLAPIRYQAEAWGQEAEQLCQQIADELREAAPDLDAVEWPEPGLAEEHPDPLFASRRDYLEQIEVYKRFQHKPTEKRKRRSNGAGSAP